MSVKHKENRSVNLDMPLVLRSLDERNKFGLSFLFESGNNLGTIKEDCFLKKRIDKLNSKFYQESEKYMNYKLELERSNEKLFSFLLKEIGLFIEEIDRLNSIVNRKTENDKEKKDKNPDNNIYLKNSVQILEKKLNDKTAAEDKMKQEINSLKRQVKFYKEKLQLELLTSIKKTDLMVKVNKKANKHNVLKTSGNNSVLDGKAKTDFIHDLNTTKINELFDDPPSKDNQIEETFNKQEENGNSNQNVTIDKIPSFHSNEKNLQQTCNNIIPENKRIVSKREKVKTSNFSPKFNKIISKSPHNTFLSKEHNYNSKNTCPNNNNDKTKINLNKYINDAKGSNEKLSYTTAKPHIPHTSKNNKNLNVNKINDMINSAKNRSNLPSPKNLLKKEEENDKEFISFLGNISAKFDEELENLTEIENLLINSKLDLKNADKNELINKENELNTSSNSLEKKNNFLSLNQENYQNEILINKAKGYIGKGKKQSKFN